MVRRRETVCGDVTTLSALTVGKIWRPRLIELSLPLAAQPKRNLVVVHYIVCNQGCPIVKKHHAPLEMHADFIGTPGYFAQPQAAMLTRIAKSGANLGNGLGGLSLHVRRQLARCFLDSFREQNPDHSLPVNVSSLPALRDNSISASAEFSAAVAWANVTPNSSNTGKSLGRKGSSPRIS